MKTSKFLSLLIAIAINIPSVAKAAPQPPGCSGAPPRRLVFKYNCGGGPNSAEYEVSAGSKGLNYDTRFRTYRMESGGIFLDRLGWELLLAVSVRGANCSSVQIADLSLGILPRGQTVLASQASASSFGAKP
ncbi:MAG: hypothetical protein EBZ48_06890 [Proteobacteria bacterium]|nr:hypothetical protein [Pseudomonadota bacterium]